MLDNLFSKINNDLQKEQDREDFSMLLHEDFESDNFIDNKLLNLNENGVNDEMLKNEMPFLFIEDTVVDDELVTRLQNEIDYEDNYERKPISDNDETTKLQEPEDFSDDFSAQYASDAEADTKLNKEVDYVDNQKTPVNIDEFSNEATELLFEMGDILGAMNLLEDECDGSLLSVNCPDEGEVIPQADEAEVCDTEDPSMPEGVVMEAEEEKEDDVDVDSLDEDFFSLFESSEEEDEEEDKEEEDEDDEEEEDEEEDKEEEDEDDDEELDEECGKGKLKESTSILDLFA